MFILLRYMFILLHYTFILLRYMFILLHYMFILLHYMLILLHCLLFYCIIFYFPIQYGMFFSKIYKLYNFIILSEYILFSRNSAMRECVNPKSLDEVQEAHIPGDGKGGGGLDTLFFSNLSR